MMLRRKLSCTVLIQTITIEVLEISAENNAAYAHMPQGKVISKPNKIESNLRQNSCQSKRRKNLSRSHEVFHG